MLFKTLFHYTTVKCLHYYKHYITVFVVTGGENELLNERLLVPFPR